MRKLFHWRPSGAYAEDDHDYTLVTDDEGHQSVEHEHSRVDVYNGGGTDKTTSSASVDEFLSGSEPEGVKEKLRRLLGRE